jgi:hypothetical protein
MGWGRRSSGRGSLDLMLMCEAEVGFGVQWEYRCTKFVWKGYLVSLIAFKWVLSLLVLSCVRNQGDLNCNVSQLAIQRHNGEE